MPRTTPRVRFAAEMKTAPRDEFFRELVAHLPTDALQPLIDALRARLAGPTT